MYVPGIIEKQNSLKGILIYHNMVDDIMFGRSGSGDNDTDVDPKDVDKIRDMLDSDEDLLMTVRQTRLGNVSVTGRNICTMFATNKRLLVVKPKSFGFSEDVEEYSYDQITSVKLAKGPVSSAIKFTMPGMTELSKSSGIFGGGSNDDTGAINAIPKDKAEKMFEIIRAKINDAKERKSQPSTVVQQQQQSPLDLLNQVRQRRDNLRSRR